MSETKFRLLREIGNEIENIWGIKPPSQSTINHSMPYLRAIQQMDYVGDMYGMEYGDMVVAYLLNNLRNWRGEDARRIKAELKDQLEHFNKQRKD